MSNRSIIICYGGRWESSSDGIERYIGFTNNVGIKIKRKTKYEWLVDKICSVVGIDKALSKLILKFEIQTPTQTLLPFQLNNDDDVAFFLDVNRTCWTPLCVTVGRNYRSKEVQTDTLEEFGVQITYATAWRATEHAKRFIVGTLEHSYRLLPTYSYALMLENPGTVTHLELDENNCFKYYFVSLASCINGFHSSIRPIIAVDGTFLKGAYSGSMFVAVCKDGNNQIFPLAWAIVDSENDASWHWFMEKLLEVVGDMENLVFISDRHTSIEKAIHNVFPNAYHGFCIYHLKRNLITKFKLPTEKKKRGGYLATYFTAAKVYRNSEFREMFENMRQMRLDVTDYLENEVGLMKWVRSQGAYNRYNIMTTNIAKSVNAVARDACKLPITALVEWIREVTQNWFYERREAASRMKTYLMTWAHDEVWKEMDEFNRMTVQSVACDRLVVKDGEKRDIVDLSARTCSCKKFEYHQLPCGHAMAVFKVRRLQYEGFCSNYYTSKTLMQAYSEPVQPVDYPLEWLMQGLQQNDIHPPVAQRQSGRR